MQVQHVKPDTKKMKTVFNNSTVAHVWANQQQEHGMSPNRNFFFEGESIYSYGYHFRIAKYHTNEQGEIAVLFTNRTYSVSTANHINYTLQAIAHDNIIYCHNPNGHSHTGNFEEWLKDMDSTAKSLQTAKKPEKYLNRIGNIFLQVKRYAEYFRLDIPLSIVALSEIQHKDEYNHLLTQRAELAKLQKIAEEKKVNKAIKEQLKKWRSFKIDRLTFRNEFDYLRFNALKNRVETSQSVQIPTQKALEFYKWVKNTLANGGCTGNCHQTILHYGVKEVTKSHIHIGCHKIKMVEVEKILNLMGYEN